MTISWLEPTLSSFRLIMRPEDAASHSHFDHRAHQRNSLEYIVANVNNATIFTHAKKGKICTIIVRGNTFRVKKNNTQVCMVQLLWVRGS